MSVRNPPSAHPEDGREARSSNEVDPASPTPLQDLDSTDRKRNERERDELDRQLLDAQKWESLGVLAGGVAHDFNNLLTIVLGHANLARRSAGVSPVVDAHLTHIEDAGQRAADLCRQLLACAGRGPAPTGSTDLNAVIRASGPLIDLSAARHARVRLDLTPNLPPCHADSGQVRQVLLNLVMNAGEVLVGNGNVVVRTGLVEVTASESPAAYRLHPEPGRYVVLDVSDDGPGIPPDVVGRMFDPFFTTKFPGRGLGLAAVLGIARAHRGGIRVDTAIGRGTTMRVLFRPSSQ